MAHLFQEGQMRRRQDLAEMSADRRHVDRVASRDLHAIARQRGVAAIAQPVLADRRVRQEIEEKLLVVAHEEDLLEPVERAVDQPVDHAGAVRSAVDIVAQIDDDAARFVGLVGIPGDQPMHFPQEIGTTVHVTDRVNPRIGWRAGKLQVFLGRHRTFRPIVAGGRPAPRKQGTRQWTGQAQAPLSKALIVNLA